ncbi:MAG: putative lipid II flippase FtsW [Gammaproteobacteria bacterium]|jgi:cell division protein FtsW|nr:putative lipid II flippase FtsW [Gammaproteobacteria bacterium]
MAGVNAQAMRGHRDAPPAPAWDDGLMLVVAGLLGLGLVMVFSTTVSRAGGLGVFAHHGGHLAAGVVLMYLVSRLRAETWQRLGPWLVFASGLLLIAVLIDGVGMRINGSSRWLRLGALTLQPSELAKIALILYTAGYLTRHRERLTRFSSGILMVGMVVGIFAMLLLMEPDFGGAAVMVIAVAGMIFLGGVRFWHFLVCALTAVAGMVALVWLSPYRMARVTGFLDPFADPFNSGFQLVQALIALGRGEWFGVGLGASVQKLHYLPAASTDFVFAVLGEELGFVGVLAVIALFALFVWRAFELSRQAELIGQVFAARLAQGVGLLVGLQAMVNMGVNLGLLPTKGLTLPFMSYGGSSLLAVCVAVGLLLVVAREIRPSPGVRR